MKSRTDALYFLPEKGDMCKMIRTTKWSQTPVGPISGWPQSLRTTLGITMNSGLPMLLCWGPDLTCFFNDAFKPVFGPDGAGVQALGKKAEAVFPAIWNGFKSVIDKVMTGESFYKDEKVFFPIQGSSRLENIYQTFSYSPVFGEDDVPAGVLVTCPEITGVNPEKKQWIEDDEFEQTDSGLRSIIMQAPFAMSVLKGKEYVVEIANRHALEMWGRSYEEVIGKPIFEAMPELETQGIKSSLDDVFTTGKRFSATELPVKILRDGKLETSYINFSYEPLTCNDGTVERIMPVGIDVTELILARHKEEENRKLLSAMIESAPFPIGVYTGREMRIQLANKAMLKTFGKGDLVTGKLYSEILPELQNQEIFQQLEEVFTTGKAFHARNRRVDIVIDGVMQIFYFNYSFTPLLDGAGKVYGIMNTGADVTDLNVAKHQAEKSEQRLNLAVEASNLGVGEVDFEKQQLIYNGKYLDIFGLKEEGVFSLKELIAKIHPDDLATRGALIGEAIKTGAVNHNIRLLLPDNNYHWIHAQGKMFYEEGKAAPKLKGTFRDVTEAKNNQRELQENEAKLNLILEACGMAPLEYRIQTDEFIYSDKNLEIFGLSGGTYYTRDELLAMFHPDDAALAARANLQALTTGLLNYEARIIWPDKSVHWIHSIGKVFYDSHGKPLKILGAVRDVTNEKNYHEQIKESNERLNLVIDASKLGTFELFLKGDRLLCSGKCLEIYGNKADSEYDHNLFLSRIHPEDMAVRNEAVKLASATGILDYESRVIWPDASIHWVHAVGKMFFDEDGKPFKILGTVRDITKDKKYQQEIKENEERLQIVIAAAELGTWELDLEKGAVTWSERGVEIFGLMPGEMYQQSEMIRFFHPDDLHIRARALTEALKTGVLLYAVRIIWPDKSLHWIEVKGKVFYNAEHKPVRMLGTIRDITKERTYQQQLRERERHFRMLANAMPQLVWVANKDGVVTFYNRRIAEFEGAVQLPDGSWKWDAMLHPADLEATQEAWNRALKMQVPYSKEHRVKMKDGEYRWFLSRAKPQKDSDGNVNQWYGSATDIHEIKEQDQQKDFFINMASHELKTPITSIKGYTQLLDHAYQKSDDRFLKDSLAVINKQVSKLTNLIADLLDLSKIKSGALPLNQEQFNLVVLVQEVIDEISLIHKGHSIQLTGNEVALVFADRVRIGQVLINLVNNAIKYSPGSTSVIINCLAAGGHVTVAVEDFGIGISSQEQEKIFQRFYRVEGKNENTFPGFGIGLFISAEIVHRHNGTIGVSSEKGKGSTFYFTLPLHEQ